MLQQRYELSYSRCRGKASPTGLGRAVGKPWKGDSGWTLGRWAGGPSLPKSLPFGRPAWLAEGLRGGGRAGPRTLTSRGKMDNLGNLWTPPLGRVAGSLCSLCFG